MGSSAGVDTELRACIAQLRAAQADTVQAAIMSQQQWALAPLAGTLSCTAPGIMMRGTGPGRTQFPSWLGRNSTANKRQRLLREACGHMAARVSATKNEVRTSYIPALRPRLLGTLASRGADGVQQTLDALEEYSLSKDDFDKHNIFVGSATDVELARRSKLNELMREGGK